jgi:hypothetical protein
MTKDWGLFGTGDSEVQKEGARGARTPTALLMVYNEIKATGPVGITFSELQAATGRNYNSVGPRVRELGAAGLVINTGRTRQSLISTKQQVVWQVAAPGAGVPIPGPGRRTTKGSAAEWARLFRTHCHAQRRGWQGRPDDDGRSDLWLARAMGMSAFLDWLGEDE